ncbi:hypothetical protein [Kitasatospora sp. MAP5-34]|uniref:hypothetical protein n=1 Tax=Kitasatospora sp. MAP5-34 TaxID=3035102 RepID=UPI0024769B6C|nr:hypothetical protein [Kitasatospora sp. MAP5-34]MDH6578371.1 hypothetical protein [Kitasatospora sp. MAP5-34]
MRATWTAAALAAALGLTTVTAVSVNVASAADAATATTVIRSAPVAVPAAAPASAARPAAALPGVPALPSVPAVPALPAVPDPTKSLDVLGALGGVLKLVTGLVSTAIPASGTPDPAALQKLVSDLQAAVKDLLAKLPGVPALPPVPGAPSVPGAPPLPPLPLGGPVRAVPGDLPVPAVLSPADALAKVQKDVGDLTAAATAAKPDPATVKKLVGPLSLDAVAATTATATSLAGA